MSPDLVRGKLIKKKKNLDKYLKNDKLEMRLLIKT